MSQEGYQNNPNIPKQGAVHEYSPAQLRDLKKCKKNILYFAENFFHIIDLDKGKQKIALFPFQRKVLRQLRDNRFNIVLASRQVGKALDEDTPIPTPNGWVRMGDLKAGDQVFDENGEICNVVHAHDTLHDRECFEVEFDNGEKIIADGDHLWYTESYSERYSKKGGSAKTTKEIAGSVHSHVGTQPSHRIPLSIKGIQSTEKELLIDPYTFGAWLGGKPIGAVSVNHLKHYNLLNNKHVPTDYMFCSREQKIRIVKGLLDAHGIVSKLGTNVYFNTDNEVIANDVMHLLGSIGYKVAINNLSTKTVQLYRLSFTPREHVFEVREEMNDRINVEYQRSNSKYSRWHYIKAVTPVESRPVRCITVDSKNSLYMAGKQFIPTHNTTLFTIYALWIALFNDYQKILIVANKEGTAIEIFQRVRMAYEELPNWMKPGAIAYGKTSMTLENGTVIGISTTTGTAARGQSVNCLILDELAFIENHLVDEFWKSVYPIISSSKKSKILIASTANGTDNLFYRLFTGSERKENNFANSKIYWHEDPRKDEEWKKETMSSLGSVEAFEQEFNCNFIAGGKSAIDLELFEELKIGVREPIQVLDDGAYRVFELPDEDGIYVAGVDTAEGVGRDASVIQVLNLKDLSNITQAAIYHNNLISPYEYTTKLVNVMAHWGNPPCLIERNNQGTGVIDRLVLQHHYENVVSYGASKAGKSVNQQLGMISHTNVKYQMITNSRYWINELKCTTITDTYTLNEYKDFVQNANQTWGAKRGCKDDRVMAMNWALMILHKDIVDQYFEVTAYDENLRPRVIIPLDTGLNRFKNAASIYTLAAEDNNNIGSPSLFGGGMQQDSDMAELEMQGWRLPEGYNF